MAPLAPLATPMACSSELSHFTLTAIHYFGVSGDQRKKFA